MVQVWFAGADQIIITVPTLISTIFRRWQNMKPFEKFKKVEAETEPRSFDFLLCCLVDQISQSVSEKTLIRTKEQ